MLAWMKHMHLHQRIKRRPCVQDRGDVITCLVTGNLEPIGWAKMDALGIKHMFTEPYFGGFGSDYCNPDNSEQSWKDRAELVKISAQKAHKIFPGNSATAQLFIFRLHSHCFKVHRLCIASELLQSSYAATAVHITEAMLSALCANARAVGAACVLKQNVLLYVPSDSNPC